MREAGTGGRVLQLFTYATSNASGNSRLGKLQSARTYNHPTVGLNGYTVDVSETYTYGGKQGRVSKRDTSVAISANGGPYGAADTFTQNWTWNDLGEVASLGYPSCTAPQCGAPSPRTVSRTFTRGFLTAVTGHASSVTYHPNGQAHQIVRSNGVTDTYQKDPYNLPRPAKIEARTTATSTLLWGTGAYAFDGAGNVTRNGGSYFLYDLSPGSSRASSTPAREAAAPRPSSATPSTASATSSRSRPAPPGARRPRPPPTASPAASPTTPLGT